MSNKTGSQLKLLLCGIILFSLFSNSLSNPPKTNNFEQNTQIDDLRETLEFKNQSDTSNKMSSVITGYNLIAYAENAVVQQNTSFYINLGVMNQVGSYIAGEELLWYVYPYNQYVNIIETESFLLTVEFEATQDLGNLTIAISTLDLLQTKFIKILIVEDITDYEGGTEELSLLNYLFDNEIPVPGTNKITLEFYHPNFIFGEAGQRIALAYTHTHSGNNYTSILGSAPLADCTFICSYYTIEIELEFEIPIFTIPGSWLEFKLIIVSSRYILPNNTLTIQTLPNGQLFVLSSEIPLFLDRSNLDRSDFTSIKVNIFGNRPNQNKKIEIILSNIIIHVEDNLEHRNDINLIIPYDSPLGDSIIIVYLKDQDTVLEEKSFPIKVIEEIYLQINYYPNIIQIGSNINFEFFTYREDNYNPQSSIITISNEFELINNFNTSNSGLKYFNFTFGQLLPNYWDILIEPINNDNLSSQTIRWFIASLIPAEIETELRTQVVEKGKSVVLEASIITKIDENMEGTLLLTDSQDVILAEYPLSEKIQVVTFILSLEHHQRGRYEYQWVLNSDQFVADSINFIILVYAKTQFVSVAVDDTRAMEGDIIKIHGFVKESNGSNINSQLRVDLFLRNATGEHFLAHNTSDLIGEFYFYYKIKENFGNGLLIFIVKFHRNDTLYLFNSVNNPMLEVHVKSSFGLSIYEINLFKINKEINLTITGRPTYLYQLEYTTEEMLVNGSGWQELGQYFIPLYQTELEINLQLPSTTGYVQIRIVEELTTKFIIYPIILLADPVFLIDYANDTPAFEPIEFRIQTSEQYQLMMDNKKLLSINETLIGNHQFNMTFEPGPHELRVEFTSEFLTEKIVSYYFTVFQSVYITYETGTNYFYEGNNFPMNITVQNTKGDKLTTVHVQALAQLSETNYQVMAEGLTDQNGVIYLEPQLFGSSLVIKINSHELLFIKEDSVKILDIKRELEDTITKDYFRISKGKTLNFKGEFVYKYTNEIVKNLAVQIVILNNNNEIMRETTIKTDVNGKIKYSFRANYVSGIYQIQLIIADEKYVPYQSTYALEINEDNFIDFTFVSTSIVAFLGILGVIYYLKRKS